MKAHYLDPDELERTLAEVRASPADGGRLEAIVARPATDERRRLEVAHLSPEGGLEGDRWASAGEPADQQVSLMNARLLRQLAGGDRARMAEAGDNLIVDLDLSDENLPSGTRLRVGGVLLEVTGATHTGCGKFASRFGPDAARFVNAARRRSLHLRGRYARVLEPGTVCVGDPIHKEPPLPTAQHPLPPHTSPPPQPMI
jgi:MOSC domain-containing protein YiiM